MAAISNPKRNNKNDRLDLYWDDYYAGFSQDFAESAIKTCVCKKQAVILDPWNGSGTTTSAAAEFDHHSVGIDLNPVMKIVAKSKQATMLAINSLDFLEKSADAYYLGSDTKEYKSDPLSTWFDESGLFVIRKFENLIVNHQRYKSTNDKVNSLDSSQCLLYTILFDYMRSCLEPFIPSNPTWIKKPKSDSEKISLTWKSFEKYYNTLIEDLQNRNSKTKSHPDKDNKSLLIIGSSTCLPLKSCSIDLVLTSPPYCTRIDYGVATAPELSLISVDGKKEIDSIRRNLMGTTTVPKKIVYPIEELGESCLAFLARVKDHDSKASSTYYHKNFTQYFISLNKSISEISRVLLKGGKFVCVVQDSFYKEIHCDLPSILVDMSQKFGLRFVDEESFESRQHMANVNNKSRVYRGDIKAFESVLFFER